MRFVHTRKLRAAANYSFKLIPSRIDDCPVIFLGKVLDVFSSLTKINLYGPTF
jgi:hypothetical protein